ILSRSRLTGDKRHASSDRLGPTKLNRTRPGLLPRHDPVAADIRPRGVRVRMSQLVVRGEDTESALLSALKLLEIQKTLGAEPVLAALRHFPAQAARHTEFPPDLHPKLKEVLQARGVARPYTHQALAYEAAREGRSTVVVTPTASGKTLCYNLP